MTPRTLVSPVAALLGPALPTPAHPGRPLTTRPRPDTPSVKPAAVGEEVRTGATQRRRLLLADGSVVYVNAGSEVKVAGERRLRVSGGAVFVDVAPRAKGAAAFTVVTPD